MVSTRSGDKATKVSTKVPKKGPTKTAKQRGKLTKKSKAAAKENNGGKALGRDNVQEIEAELEDPYFDSPSFSLDSSICSSVRGSLNADTDDQEWNKKCARAMQPFGEFGFQIELKSLHFPPLLKPGENWDEALLNTGLGLLAAVCQQKEEGFYIYPTVLSGAYSFKDY